MTEFATGPVKSLLISLLNISIINGIGRPLSRYPLAQNLLRSNMGWFLLS